MSHFLPRNKLTKLIAETCAAIDGTEAKKAPEKYIVPTETIQILQLFGENFIAEVFKKAATICVLRGENNVTSADVQFVLEEMDIVFGNKKVWDDEVIPSKEYIDKYNDAPKY
ncbi:hypothetical protein CDIK_2004 [Cucumispora dikerogammari]|nr:hypothetical protein CDIK_2004 [Cucumispora dikerogammari]